MLYLVFFIAVILLLLLLFIRVNIVVEYNRKNKDDNLSLSFYALGGILKYKYEAPLVDFQKKGIKFKWIKEKGIKEKDLKKTRTFHDLGELYDRFFVVKEIFERHVKRKLLLKEFNLNIRFGTGDAFYTGILGGTIWTFVGMVTAFICNNFEVLKKKINVQPDFSKKVLNIDLFCIFSIRVVNIIFILSKVLKDYLTGRVKLKKLIGGDVSG